MNPSELLIGIVDDEASVRKALVRFFTAASFNALAFQSAREFLRSIDNYPFDCLVLDLQMPEMTGLDLQRFLRMVRPDLPLPVIIITAHDEPGLRERCLEAGVGAYLRKPVEGDTLLTTVEKLVGSPRVDPT